MINEQPKFTPGDHVTWTSQAGGNTKTKQGVVIAVVPAKGYMGEFCPVEFSVRSKDYGKHRPEESYLIQVGKSKRLYWPLVKYLKPVEPVELFNESFTREAFNEAFDREVAPLIPASGSFSGIIQEDGTFELAEDE